MDDEGGDRQSSRPQVSNVIRNERQLSGPQVSAEKQRQVTKTIVTRANTSIPVSTSNADKQIEDSGRRSGRGRGDPVIEVVNAQNWYGDVPGDTRKKKVGKVGDDRRPSASSQPLKKPKEATEALSSGPPNISCSCVTKSIARALLIIFDMADCFLCFNRLEDDKNGVIVIHLVHFFNGRRRRRSSSSSKIVSIWIRHLGLMFLKMIGIDCVESPPHVEWRMTALVEPCSFIFHVGCSIIKLVFILISCIKKYLLASIRS